MPVGVRAKTKRGIERKKARSENENPGPRLSYEDLKKKFAEMSMEEYEILLDKAEERGKIFNRRAGQRGAWLEKSPEAIATENSSAADDGSSREYLGNRENGGDGGLMSETHSEDNTCATTPTTRNPLKGCAALQQQRQRTLRATILFCRRVHARMRRLELNPHNHDTYLNLAKDLWDPIYREGVDAMGLKILEVDKSTRKIIDTLCERGSSRASSESPSLRNGFTVGAAQSDFTKQLTVVERTNLLRTDGKSNSETRPARLLLNGSHHLNGSPRQKHL